MALSQAILATELKAMTLYGTEAAAITAWAEAFAAYFEGDGLTQGAESRAVYITPAGVALGKSAMALALVGMSGSGNGAAKIAAGISAGVGFWNALVAAPAVAWPTVTVITPPAALAGLAAALQSTFDANRAGAKSKNDSMDAIAADIHTACQGGTATWPGPVVLPIT